MDLLKIKHLLLTVDIEKAFDYVDHQILINVLKTFGLGLEEKLARWIKILPKNQESCIINGGIATKYFKLERDTRQRDLISACLVFCISVSSCICSDEIK